ncbi:MAG: glycosyltransferase family 2 protein [Gammaproteobacteria bacterium]|nr:glycosyltransferase family 2 protein [Pseudomonadales bacterium]MCP5347524.1 glycosyltransferase family 2 protein [Pseudomonadales bacterium]
MRRFPRVAVLLPTYNGSRFIGAQLDSILAQTVTDLIIVTRDDGSSDSTREVVQDYARRQPDRFHVVVADGRNLGPGGSFSLLMQYVLERRSQLGLEPLRVLLCDQDDVWDSRKVERELEALFKLESRFPGLPALVHSDLSVVAADLTPIAGSFLAYHGLDGNRNDLRNLIFSNTVTGCSALLNESLLRKALPVPEDAMMHDWWLALVAAAFGHIGFLPERLVQYRQHDHNTLGAREYQPRKLFSKTTWQRLWQKNPDPMLFAVARQAETFRARYGKELSRSDRLTLGLASRLRTDSFLLQRVLFRLLRF